jgi:TRAP-type transport system small permease protein
MMLWVARAISAFSKAALYGAALIGATMSVIVFVSVTMRYVFLSPMRFTDELVGLLFSAGVFLAIPYLFASDRNIRVSLVADRLSGPIRGLVGLLSNLAIICFFLILGYLSFDFTSFSILIGARSDVARIPVAPWMALMPFSCFLTAFIVLLKTSFEPFGVRLGDEEPVSSDGPIS